MKGGNSYEANTREVVRAGVGVEPAGWGRAWWGAQKKTAALQGYGFALGAVLIWSGFILVSRVGGVSPLLPNDVIAIRYLTCALVVLPFWWFKFRFNFFQLRFVGVSLVGGLAYALCTFRGFREVPASQAALLLPGLLPLFTTATSFFVNGEEISRPRMAGVVLISMGVAGLYLPLWMEGGGFVAGHWWLMVGAFCWAVFTALVKRWDISPWQATVSLAVVTCCLYLPVYWFCLLRAITWESWGGMWMPHIALQAFYQGVLATVVQMLCFVRAVQLLGASQMGAIMGGVPILAGILAVLFLSEPFHWMLVIGLAFVSLGAWVAHFR